MWTGTYSVDQIPSQGSLEYSFIIYGDGTLSTKGKTGSGKDAYATGTWTLSIDSVFTGTTTSSVTSGLSVQQRITGKYSKTGVITGGTWNDTNNPFGSPLSGKFSTMQRVN